MIQRRTCVGALIGGAAASFAVNAQTARPLPLIGFLGPPVSAGGFLGEFQQGLFDLGYVEGRTVRIEYRFNVAIQGNYERLTELAAELVKLRPDVLVVSLTEVALAMKSATSTIPIVMCNVADPVAAGLVSSLARPGGNVTGVSRQTPDLIGKQFQLLRELLPRATSIGVLLNPADRLRSVIVGSVRKTAETIGAQVNVLEPTTTSEVEAAFATLNANRVDAVIVGDGGILFLTRSQIAGLAIRYHLPLMCSYREPVQAGALISYAASSLANYRRAAFFVDKILKGAKPADLPIEQPTRFEMVINMKTARTLGITIPQSMLLRADEVFD